MKILFLALNVNIKGTTGDAVHVRELVHNLAKLGNSISLIGEFNLNSDIELSTIRRNENVQIYYNKKFNAHLPALFDIWNCIKAAKDNYPDIIYNRCFSCKIGYILSKILNRPFIIEVNGIADDEAKLLGIYKNYKYTSIIRKKFRQFFFKSASKIVAVSPGIKEELIKSFQIPSEKIVVIPNGANTELFMPMCQETAKKELGLDISKKYVCFVGNLAPWQGVECLVEAAPLVIENAPETRFLIVGDGMMYIPLQNLVKEYHLEKYFYFTGRIPYDVVPKFINASDICVSPFIRARNEKIGLSPLKIYEYMACGKPVIGSNINGVGDFLEKSNAGISFTAENAVEFSKVLIRLLKDDQMRENMGQNGMKLVNEYFNWNNTAKKIINFCESVIREININKL